MLNYFDDVLIVVALFNDALFHFVDFDDVRINDSLLTMPLVNFTLC